MWNRALKKVSYVVVIFLHCSHSHNNLQDNDIHKNITFKSLFIVVILILFPCCKVLNKSKRKKNKICEVCNSANVVFLWFKRFLIIS